MFSAREADFVVNFFNSLKHTKGEWHGVKFELLPWQEKALREIFGTLKPDGYRQYNTAYIETPKKNGKSELGAGIGLYMTCGDGEWGAEVYGCASDRSQASIVFDVAVDMVDQCPALKKRIKLIASKKRMVYTPTNSFYQVLSAEAFTKHGFNVHACIFDELHSQPNRELYDVMTKGSGDARRQPLFFVITTAGDDPDRNSIGWEVHKKAIDTLAGLRNDPGFYATVYGIEPEENRIWTGRKFKLLDKVDWENPKIWKMVNPSFGPALDLSKIKQFYDSAKGNPADERTFRWLRLNEWVKYRNTKWIPLEAWDNSAGLLNVESLKGRKCYAGMDLSSTTDITAFVQLFPPDENNETWAVLPTFWMPEEGLAERAKEDGVPYLDWVKQGFIKTTPGNVIDYQFIRKTISGYNPNGLSAHCLRDDYDITELGFDPWHSVQVALDLTDDGLNCVEVRQGFKTLSPAMKELERLIRAGLLNHGGNPVLRWMFGNLTVKTDENENIRPVKDKSTGRIDGIVALVIALARAVLHEEDSVSVYEERGLISL